MFIRERESAAAAGQMSMKSSGLEPVKHTPEILMLINQLQSSMDVLEKDAHDLIERLQPVARMSNATMPVPAPYEEPATELGARVQDIQRRCDMLRASIIDAITRLEL